MMIAEIIAAVMGLIALGGATAWLAWLQAQRRIAARKARREALRKSLLKVLCHLIDS